jgi:Sigma-70, region 4
MRHPQLILEKELDRLLGGGRDARIVARYTGFDGRGGESLQSVGNAFGVTRERIRQIADAASTRLRTGRPVSPVLDRTIALVADHIPAAIGLIAAGVIEAEVRSKGLTAGLFRLEGVIKAAKLLGRHVPFAITEVNGRRLVHLRDLQGFESIVQIARRVAARYGMATVSDVAAKLHNGSSGLYHTNLIASLLDLEPGFRWLDRSAGWFRSDTGVNPVLGRIRRILSVANPIRLAELEAAIVRETRMKGFSPPRSVLLEFCRQAPGLRVCGDTIEARPRISPAEVLSPVEDQMARILSEHSGTMAVSEFLSICLRKGMNPTTCYQYLVRSPIFSKQAYQVCGLVRSEGDL